METAIVNNVISVKSNSFVNIDFFFLFNVVNIFELFILLKGEEIKEEIKWGEKEKKREKVRNRN